MKTIIVTIATVMALSVSAANAAWYNPVTWGTGSACKNVPYDRSDWKFNGRSFKTNVLKEQAKSRQGFVGDTFVDQYTGDVTPLYRINSVGNTIANAEVDHIVPLKVVHANGGCKWSKAKKKAFANNPKNLALTSMSNNRIKGTKTPSRWLPYKNQAAYLNKYNAAAEVAKVPSFKIKAFKFNSPKVVKFIKTGSKVAGYTAAGALVIFSGAGAAAILIPVGIDIVDEILVISEDPDIYVEDLTISFSDAYQTSLSWTSESWDNTKEWTSYTWNNSIDWSGKTWESVTDWTGNRYNDAVDIYNRY